MLSGIPRSRATWATGWADSRTNRTASRLKSSVYRRRVPADMVTSDFTILPLMGVSVKSGEGHITISGKPATFGGIAKHPFPVHPTHRSMAQGIQQTREDSPRFTIDCVLPLASTQLQAY